MRGCLQCISNFWIEVFWLFYLSEIFSILNLKIFHLFFNYYYYIIFFLGSISLFLFNVFIFYFHIFDLPQKIYSHYFSMKNSIIILEIWYKYFNTIIFLTLLFRIELVGLSWYFQSGNNRCFTIRIYWIIKNYGPVSNISILVVLLTK